ncbi:unnamed protein product [Eretmochelys imbricata]
MASALMNFFLGCWLAGQSGVSGQSGESGQLPAPRPSISASPSGVIALGGAVTIRCQCRCEARRLFLYKGRFQIQELDADGDEGEFTIPRAKREDGGAYSCRSRSRSEPPNWSYRSNIVWIIAAELSYPKPSISLQPSGGVVLGGTVTIQCWGPLQNVRFLLYKEGSLNALQNAELPGVEFLIRSVSRKDAGSYSCYYQHKSDLSMWSQPSDPVELVVADPSLPRPSISLSPTGVTAPGANVTIRCQGQSRDVRFFLHKAGDLNPPRHMDPAGDGAEFCIPTVGRQHGGSYSCSYRPRSDPFVSSQPSHPVQLVVAGGTDPTQPGVSLASTHPGCSGPAGPPGRPDFTQANIAHLVLSAMVLLVLGLILAEAYYSRPRGAP